MLLIYQLTLSKSKLKEYEDATKNEPNLVEPTIFM